MILLEEDQVVVKGRPLSTDASGYRERLYQSPKFQLYREKRVALRLCCDWSNPEVTGWYLRLLVGSVGDRPMTESGVLRFGFVPEFSAETSRFHFSRLPDANSVRERWRQLVWTRRYRRSLNVALLDFLQVHTRIEVEFDFDIWAPSVFRVAIGNGDPVPGCLPAGLRREMFFSEKSSVDD